MKKIYFGLLIGGAGLMMAACDSQRSATPPETTNTAGTVMTTPPRQATDTAPATPTDPGEISAEVAASSTFVSDADFAAKAVESGMAEVKFGHLADRKAVDPEVKKFGLEMVQEHTNANARLMQLTKTRKWPTPDDMNEEHLQAYNYLSGVMSDEFDQGYISQMVQDHENAVAMYQQAASRVTDPELKSFVDNTLPALKRHLGMARDLQRKINASR